MRIAVNFKVPFIKWRFYFIAASLILMAASLYFVFVKGLNYGIDFRGGMKLTYHFTSTIGDGDLEKNLAAAGFSASVQQLGEATENRYTIKLKLDEAKTSDEVIDGISGALTNAYGGGSFILESEESVGPKVGEELQSKGQMAILFTLLAMMIYIALRFDFNFAPGAFLTLLHDVIIVLGFMAFFNVEYNLTTLAAILTIVGYSINDTIIIYDRIREHAGKITPASVSDVVNESINETLSRTIITSLTVFFVVLALFIMGGGVIHDFAFCFLVGVVVGTYSTIFISSPIYIGMYNHWPKVAHWFGGKGR